MAHITNEMTDEQIKKELSVHGEKILVDIIRNDTNEITGYHWACDKDGCNCDGGWTDQW